MDTGKWIGAAAVAGMLTLAGSIALGQGAFGGGGGGRVGTGGGGTGVGGRVGTGGGKTMVQDPTKVPQVTAVCQYVSYTKGIMWGKPSLNINLYSPVTRLAWRGMTMDGGAVGKMLDGLKKGDYLKVTSGDYMGTQTITAISPYKLKPNEDHPDAFIFQSSEEVQVNRKPVQIVVIEKLGVDVKLPVLTHQDETGKVTPDADVLAAAAKLKKGEVVEVDTQLSGGRRSVRYIAPFTAPIEGKFDKMELTGKEGDRKGTIEYTANGETKKLDIDMVGPLKYQEPDPAVIAAAKRFKAGDSVQIKTRKAGDKDVVMRLSPGKAEKPDPKDAPKDPPKDKPKAD